MTQSTTPKRPNVLVFFTDQQRWDSTGLAGNPLDLTPNFDRVARANTYLPSTFTPQPVCGPARACLQTGQYATSTGVWHNGLGLRDDAVTLAHCFNDAGYRTGYIGKWHLGGTKSPQPQGPVPVEHRGGYQDWLAANSVGASSEHYKARLWNNDNQPVDLPGYRVDAFADAAIRYIHDRCQESQPFFLFLSLHEPHNQGSVRDYPAPTGYRERYEGRWIPSDLAALPAWGFDGKNPNNRRLGGNTHQFLGSYWGMVRRIDEALGRVLDALQSLGISDDTILLFTSDHGCHFSTRNSEFKRSCHDSSIRVPTLLAGPGFDVGGNVRELVSLIDLPPTLLDAAGLPIPSSMMGRSICPLLRRDRSGWPEDVFVQITEKNDGRALRTHRWKYSVTGNAPAQGRSERYTETHLYDLQHDPHELYNLIGVESHAATQAQLRQRLLERIQSVEGYQPMIDPHV